MDLQSFTLGIVSVIISFIIGVIIYTFFRVQKLYRRTDSISENMRSLHNGLDQKIKDNYDYLSRTIERDRQESIKGVDEIYRALGKFKEDVSKKEIETVNAINRRFDKFENRLNSECFKDSSDNKLYS